MALRTARGIDPRRRIFDSIFTTSPLTESSPTPHATPNLAAITPGQPWGIPAGDTDQTDGQERSLAERDVARSRAWHVATSFLQPHQRPISVSEIQAHGPERFLQLWLKEPSDQERTALEVLLSTASNKHGTSLNAGVNELVDWYSNAVRQHFTKFVRPGLALLSKDDGAESQLKSILVTLQAAQRVYSEPLVKHVLSIAFESLSKSHTTKANELKNMLMSLQWRFRRDLHAVVSFCLPELQLKELVVQVTESLAATVLDVELDDGQTRNITTEQASAVKRQARETIFDIIRHLRDVGLGGNRGERIFAEVMDNMMHAYVQTRFARRWTSPSQNIQELQDWVENDYARLAVQSLACFDDDDLRPPSKNAAKPGLRVTKDDIDRWKDSAVARLGRLRVSELFSIINAWPESFGAIEDLKPYISTVQTRAHVVSSFSAMLPKQLLHPGISTTDILHFYILMILAFKALEPKGVLLDRVARPIRRYLRDRDDTIKIIVTGLLTDLQAAKSQAKPFHDVYTHLARMVEPIDAAGSALDDDADMDWDDMEWQPDPVDIGPDYQRSKRLDEFGNLVSLFESKEVFVREFQRGLQDRLLNQNAISGAESRIIDMLKSRLGESSLQACEVMIYDMIQSVEIQRALSSSHMAAMHGPLSVLKHTKILSRLSWPGVDETEFKGPPSIAELQQRFENGFGKLKRNRKLTWLQALGTVKVELELEDRTIQEVVTPAQASVIYAFQTGQDGAVSRTVSELEEQLVMDRITVLSCLSFWISLSVLTPTVDATAPAESYTVLERLPASSNAVHPSRQQSSTLSSATSKPPNVTSNPSVSSIPTADAPSRPALLPTHSSSSELDRQKAAAQLESKLAIYWNFIQGMLRNQGPQPLHKMLMLLNMFVPGGYLASAGSKGVDMLKGFLEMKREKGELLFEGGVWKLVK